MSFVFLRLYHPCLHVIYHPEEYLLKDSITPGKQEQKSFIDLKIRNLGKEEVKWQKKQSQRPMFPHVPAIRASHSAAAIAETR